MSAGYDNFNLAQQARTRAVQAGLQNPGLPVVSAGDDLGWGAFFQGLQNTKDAAAAKGQGFRTDFGGSDMGLGPIPAWADPNYNAARANAVNQDLTDQATKFRLSQAAVAQANAQASAMQGANTQQFVNSDSLARAFAPGLSRPQSLAAAGPMAPEVQGYYDKQDATRAELSDKAMLAQAALEKAGSKGSQDPNAPMAIPGVDLTKTGTAAIQGAPAPIQNMVKALAEGRQPWPSSFALKTPYWQGITQAVAQYDPTFDTAMASNNARQKVRNDFTSGKSAAQINALNTVMGHLSQLSDAASGLNNGSLETVNKIENYLTPGGSKTGVAIGNFNTIKNGVTSELTRVWRGTGGSEQDIKDWADTIGAAKSPQQLHGAMAQIGGMLQSKLDALNGQYKQGMGTDKIDMVTPAAQASLDKLQARGGTAPAAAAASPATPGPQRQAIPGVPGGVAEFQNGKWIRIQ